MSTKTFPGGEHPAFLIFLILSVLMHLGIYAALKLVPTGAPSRLNKPPILVDVVDLPPAVPEELSPVKKPPAHAAQREQSVRKESWPEPSPRASRPAPSPVPAPATPTKPRQGATDSPAVAAQADKLMEGAKEGVGPVEEAMKADPGAKEGAAAPKEEARPRPKIFAEPKRPELFPTDERLAELERKYAAEAPKGEVGKTLSLNTSELKYQKYLMDMKKKIEFYWEYPMLAAKNGWQGSLKVNFRINRDGSVSDISLERSSGYPMLDDAAMTAVRLATPFAPFPDNFSIEDISIKGQFTYHLFAPAPGR